MCLNGYLTPSSVANGQSFLYEDENVLGESEIQLTDSIYSIGVFFVYYAIQKAE